MIACQALTKLKLSRLCVMLQVLDLRKLDKFLSCHFVYLHFKCLIYYIYITYCYSAAASPFSAICLTNSTCGCRRRPENTKSKKLTRYASAFAVISNVLGLFILCALYAGICLTIELPVKVLDTLDTLNTSLSPSSRNHL